MQLWASKSTARFGNEASGKDLKNFELSLIRAIEAYLLTIYFILFFFGNDYFRNILSSKIWHRKVCHTQFWIYHGHLKSHWYFP